MDWNWIAGFFEGEGNISLRKKSQGITQYARLIMGQVKKEPLEAIHAFLKEQGLANPILYVRPSKNERWQPCWLLSIQIRKDVIFFLEQIVHGLYGKRQEAEDALAYLRQLEHEREAAVALAIRLREEGATWGAIREQTGLCRQGITNAMRAINKEWHHAKKWANRNEWRKDHIAQGFCGNCGKSRAESISKLYCMICLEKRRVLIRQWKQRQHADLPLFKDAV